MRGSVTQTDMYYLRRSTKVPHDSRHFTSDIDCFGPGHVHGLTQEWIESLVLVHAVFPIMTLTWIYLVRYWRPYSWLPFWLLHHFSVKAWLSLAFKIIALNVLHQSLRRVSSLFSVIGNCNHVLTTLLLIMYNFPHLRESADIAPLRRRSVEYVANREKHWMGFNHSLFVSHASVKACIFSIHCRTDFIYAFFISI